MEFVESFKVPIRSVVLHLTDLLDITAHMKGCAWKYLDIIQLNQNNQNKRKKD